MKYRVLDNDRPARYPEVMMVDPSWSNCDFATEDEAIEYALHWLNIPEDSAYACGLNLRNGTPYNYSGCGDVLRIVQIEEDVSDMNKNILGVEKLNVRIMIDDQREGGGYDIVVRNFDYAKAVVAAFIRDINWYNIEELAVGHDLGGDKTGLDLLKWIFNNYFIHGNGVPIRKFRVVSMNHVGRKNMENFLIDMGYHEVIDEDIACVVWVRG